MIRPIESTLWNSTKLGNFPLTKRFSTLKILKRMGFISVCYKKIARMKILYCYFCNLVKFLVYFTLFTNMEFKRDSLTSFVFRFAQLCIVASWFLLSAPWHSLRLSESLFSSIVVCHEGILVNSLALLAEIPQGELDAWPTWKTKGAHRLLKSILAHAQCLIWRLTPGVNILRKEHSFVVYSWAEFLVFRGKLSNFDNFMENN